MSEPRIESNHLRVFEALYRRERLQDAAEELGMSVSAVQRSLAHLRLLWRSPLFVRTGKGYAPDAKAVALYPEVRALLAGIDRLTGETGFRPSEVSRTFRIALVDRGVEAFLSPVAAEIFEEAPGVSLALRTVELDFWEDLRSGELDLVLYPGRADEMPSGYHAQALPTEEFVVVVRPEHPLLQRARDEKRTIALTELRAWRRIQVQTGSNAFVEREGAPRKSAVESAGSRTVAVWTPYFLAAAELARRTDCYLIAAEANARVWVREGKLAVLPTEPLARTFTPLLIWHDRLNGDPALQWLRGKILAGARRR